MENRAARRVSPSTPGSSELFEDMSSPRVAGAVPEVQPAPHPYCTQIVGQAVALPPAPQDSEYAGMQRAVSAWAPERRSSLVCSAASVRSDFTGTRVYGPGGSYKPKTKRRKVKAIANVGSSGPEYGKHVGTVKRTWKKALSQAGNIVDLCKHYGELLVQSSQKEDFGLLQSNDLNQIAVNQVDMWNAILSNIDEYDEVLSTIARIVPDEFSKGLRSRNVAAMGVTVVKLVETTLGEEWEYEYEEAWSYMIEAVVRPMVAVLDEMGNVVRLVVDSWAQVLQKVTVEEFGMMFYNRLFELAPNLRSMFVRNQMIMSTRLIEMLSMIISFSSDLNRVVEQMRWMGIRHVLYGARAFQIPVVGPVLIGVLKLVLGEEWTPEIENAWAEVWKVMCTAMMDAIIEGETHGKTLKARWGGLSGPFLEAASQGHLFASSCADVAEGFIAVRRVSKSSSADCRTNDASASQYLARDVGPSRVNASSRDLLTMPLMAGLRNEFPKASDPHTSSLARIYNNKALVSMKEGTGKALCEIVGEWVDCIYSPEKLDETLVSDAARLWANDVRPKHLVIVGQVLCTALEERAKEQNEDWGEDDMKAWTWFWDLCSASLNKMMLFFEKDVPRDIGDSWTWIQNNSSDFELGALFWDELNKNVPDLAKLFKRPRQSQVHHVKASLNVIAKSAQNPEDFVNNLQDLVFFHIKHGVRAHDVKPFMDVFIGIVSRALGPRWDENVNGAWTGWLDTICNIFARTLNASSHPIITGLVSGSVKEVQHAVACSARSSRIATLCTLQIRGTPVLPLMWAISEGKVGIAHYIIEDLLTIRADMEQYYYGADELFINHPDLVRVLCERAPELLEPLLDGLLWHSASMGRTNYYISHLYGEVEGDGIKTNASESPLAVLLHNAPISVFYHPIVLKLIDIKWTLFGRNVFMLSQAWFTIILTLFLQQEIITKKCGFTNERIVLTGLVMLSCLAQTWHIVHQCLENHISSISIPWMHVTLYVPQYMCTLWNLCRFASCGLLVMHSFMSCIEGSSRAVVGGFATLLLWAQFVQICILSKPLAALTYTLGMMILDITSNVFLILITIASFSTALTVLREEAFLSPSSGLLSLLRFTINVDSPVYGHTLGPLGTALMMVFALIVNMGLLNILVAQLCNTYTQLNEEKDGWALKHRASVIIEIESFMTRTQKAKLRDMLCMDEPIPFEEGDMGLSGGVQTIEPFHQVKAQAKYVPDRIIRFSGECSPSDPWPIIEKQEH